MPRPETLSASSQTDVVWLLAKADGPLTASQIDDMTGADDCASTALLRLRRRGLVRREKRPSPGVGRPAYAYTLARKL